MTAFIPNPEYAVAEFEGAALDKYGNALPDHLAALLFGRLLPPRFKKLSDGSFKEVPSHLFHEKENKETT